MDPWAIASAAAASAMMLLALGSFAQDLYDINNPGNDLTSGEYLASYATNHLADIAAVGLAYDRAWLTYKKAGTIVPQGAAPERPSGYILILLCIVEAFELMCGSGEPYDGDNLRTGSQQLAALCGLLATALPDDRWTGDAAKIYADYVNYLRQFVSELVGIDKNLGDCAADQAQFILHTRLALGLLKDILLLAHAIEWWYFANGEPEKAENWAIQACLYGGGLLVAILSVLPGVLSRTPGAKSQARHYWDTADAVLRLPDLPYEGLACAKVATTQETRAAGFEDILARMPPTSLPAHQTSGPAHGFEPAAQSGRRVGASAHRPAAQEAKPAEAVPVTSDVRGVEADVGIWAERAPVDVASIGSRKREFAWQI